MQASKHTFSIVSKFVGLLAIAMMVFVVISLLAGDDLTLPWYNTPTYVKAPFFLEYFKIDGKAHGLIADQILVWEHFSTGKYNHLAWPGYLLFGTLFIALCTISVTLTYLFRSWYLFCAGLMFFILMQLNLAELGFLPDYIGYLSLFVFVGSTYYFQSIRPQASLAMRTISIALLYGILAAVIGLLAPIILPLSGTLAFGLFAPLILVALMMIFVGGDTMQVLFNLATKSSTKGKNGLIHFMSIGLIYIILLVLMFLDKTGSLQLDLWGVNPYIIFLIGLICGHLSLPAKMQVSKTEMPTEMITRWLYPSLAALSLALMSFAILTGNDSLSETLEIGILATHLGGAIVYFLYAFINFAPALLTNEKVLNFFAGFRAPLLTARVLHLVFLAGVFFYLDSQPYYQARAARYTALGTMGENVDSEVLATQYYKQAKFYDYYNFKANYSLARTARKEGNQSEFIDYIKSAEVRQKEGKATVALSNYYSDREQLFNKLITLKESADPGYRLINNLGIAHFEFNHYDSSFMAFDRSEELKSTETVLTNKLSLQYYSGISSSDEIVWQDARSRINAQAVNNRLGYESAFEHELATDTLLYQEDLYYLYNRALNKNLTDADALMAALDYYLSNRKNTPSKSFLLTALALQHYEAGHVNEAFESMAELLVIDPGNRAKNAFILGLWAAQQQAHVLATEYLDMAIAGRYREDDAMNLKTAMAENKIPQPERHSLFSPMSGISEEELDKYRMLAQMNAFDVVLTSNALSVLKSEGADAQELYELLRKSITINPYDLTLVTTYAWQSIEAGLAAQGRYGLEALRGKVDDVELDNALAEFEQRLTDWRNRPDPF